MAYDHARAPRIGQRAAVESPGIDLVATEADLPDPPYTGQAVCVGGVSLYIYDGSTWAIMSGGGAGPPGPAGAATLAGMYNWEAPPDQVQGFAVTQTPTYYHELTPGMAQGADIGPIGSVGRMSINQIDNEGLNFGFFTLQIGQTLIVRDAMNSGLHRLQITVRETCSDTISAVHACIRYVVIDTTAQPLAGHQAQVMLLGAIETGGTTPPVSVEFRFVTSSTDWLMNHNLNTMFIEVNCYDLAGEVEYDPEIEFVDANNIAVHWYYPMSGIARLLA